jgi:hypothetical protein
MTTESAMKEIYSLGLLQGLLMTLNPLEYESLDRESYSVYAAQIYNLSQTSNLDSWLAENFPYLQPTKLFLLMETLEKFLSL